MLKNFLNRIARLSDSERASLAKLCRRGTCSLPAAHELRFLELGLVELSCGALAASGWTRIALQKAVA